MWLLPELCVSSQPCCSPSAVQAALGSAVFPCCPRFLDNRLFATCSDDTTIALWDLRKLNTKVCTLHGHTSWVKNIEYDTNTRLLVTSGFDGNVIIWDTNRYVAALTPWPFCSTPGWIHQAFCTRWKACLPEWGCSVL